MTKSLIVATTAACVGDYFSTEHCTAILISTPSSNAGAVFIGSKESQPHEIAAGKLVGLPVINLSDLYFKGTASDILAITIYG